MVGKRAVKFGCDIEFIVDSDPTLHFIYMKAYLIKKRFDLYQFSLSA